MNLVYKSSLYDEFRIKRILENMLKLAEKALVNEKMPLSDLHLEDYTGYAELGAEFEQYFETNDLI